MYILQYNKDLFIHSFIYPLGECEASMQLKSADHITQDPSNQCIDLPVRP